MNKKELNPLQDYGGFETLNFVVNLTFRIIEFLKNGERCVCEIIPMTGKSQPAVSQHLRILSEAGILKSRKEGTSVYYTINDKRVMGIIRMLNGN